MGVGGLLKLLDHVSETINLREYEGKRIAVDASSWLYKGTFAVPPLCLSKSRSMHTMSVNLVSNDGRG